MSDDSELFSAWVDATVEAEAPPPALRARLLASLAGPARFAALAAALGRVTDLGAEAIAALLAKVDDPAAWSDAPFPGVRYFHFTPGAGAAVVEAGFVRLAPGARFPHHRHLGHEVTFVLDGLLEDRGQVYGPGSVVESAAGTEHDYSAGAGRDLVIVSLHDGVEYRA
ncbi:MAG TPA: cupin domain-containing protein [Polyangia bacterium]|nr:cupin domain-containing protein [Polyangia bacterium]